MGLISFTAIQDGTTGQASQVNNPLTTIYDEFNGSISAANLATDAVTTAKIADSAVTPDKMDFGAQSASSTTSGTTTSTSYTATLTGGGTNPSVTVTVPSSGKLLVMWEGTFSNDTAGSRTYMAPALSGANTVAASDNIALHWRPATNGLTGQFGTSYMFTGLTPGSTTVTLQHRVTANTGTYANRSLTVIPIGD